MSVSTGVDYTLIVTEDGNLYSCGKNDNGQLGLGIWGCIPGDRDKMLPTCINSNEEVMDGEDVVMASAGIAHAGCVTSQGAVWTWGCGSYGATGLGEGVEPDQISPQLIYYVPVTGIARPPAIMVACGCNFTLVLNASGRVWSCGRGDFGQLGHGNNKNRGYLTEINPKHFDDRAIAMIAVGYGHSMAVEKDTGVLWTWGDPADGKLGHGDGPDNNLLPTAIPPATFHNTVAKAAAADAAEAGRGHVYVDDVVMSMDASETFTMIVTVGGVLWACGEGPSGETGLDSRWRFDTFCRVGGPEHFGPGGVRMVTCGLCHSLIVAQNDSLWSCGSGDVPVLGFSPMDISFSDVLRPVRIPRTHFGNADIVVAAAGRTHSAAVTAAGVLYTWGRIRDPLAGFGHDSNDPQWEPRAVAPGTMNDERVGRWHGMLPEYILAFVMGLHERIGSSSPMTEFPVEPMRQMLDGIRYLPHGFF